MIIILTTAIKLLNDYHKLLVSLVFWKCSIFIFTLGHSISEKDECIDMFAKKQHKDIEHGVPFPILCVFCFSC